MSYLQAHLHLLRACTRSSGGRHSNNINRSKQSNVRVSSSSSGSFSNRSLGSSSNWSTFAPVQAGRCKVLVSRVPPIAALDKRGPGLNATSTTQQQQNQRQQQQDVDEDSDAEEEEFEQPSFRCAEHADEPYAALVLVEN